METGQRHQGHTNVFWAAEDEFRRHLEHNRRNLAYINRNITTMMRDKDLMQHMAVAYLDSAGYLLSLYCSTDIAPILAQRQIAPKTVWTHATMGSNAITDGLQNRCVCSSHGREHSQKQLTDLSIYYSPIRFEKIPVSESYHLPDDLGGVAIFVLDAYANKNYLFALRAIVHDLTMTLHCNQLSFYLYERQETGILATDVHMSASGVTIVYANKALFRALQIPAQPLNFTPLAKLLPPEKNRSFYELQRHPNNVSGATFTLTPANGQPVQCTISTLVYHQPALDAEGIVAHISTARLESHRISKKISNTAVLSFSNIIGESPQMLSAKARAAMLAQTDSNVLILGESGVGKDVFAQAIHNASARKDKPFIAVNCAALPRDLIASELFGYDSGAFTGAKKNGNMGKFELANGGTIFLDEVGDLPLDLQATLLRIVEQKKLMRLGSNKLIDIDVKIISATNANLGQMVEQRMFRSDLYFRLGTMKLNLPPLRSREGDILLLSNHFLRSISERIGRGDVPEFTLAAKQYILSYPWMGNVRELQNVMECIVQLYPQHYIQPEQLIENINMQFFSGASHLPVPPVFSEKNEIPAQIPAQNTSEDAVSTLHSSNTERKPKPKIHRKFTVDTIRNALNTCNNNRSAAAEYLGVSRKTLYRHMERLGMDLSSEG